MPGPVSSWSLLSTDHKTDIRMPLGDPDVKLKEVCGFISELSLLCAS